MAGEKCESDSGSSWGIGYNPQEVGALCGERRKVSVGLLQKVALLGTARILRQVFGEDVGV